jgi:type IV pilus assembly protein PilA
VRLIASLKARRDREEGFTLIELMVVVLIIAILIAIAIPTFLGARERAQDRAAQSDLRNGLLAAKTYYTDNETYVGFDTTEMTNIEPALSSAAITISGNSATDVILVKSSKSGKSFSICETATGTKYGSDATDCTGTKW